MGAIAHRLTNGGHALALCLIACALFLRVLVPAGWMPASGGGMAITLCTGMGTVQAWVDGDGTLHDKAPAPDSKPSGACIFAGMAAALIAPLEIGAGMIMPLAGAIPPAIAPSGVAIGLGLAAPPPPPTGPPVPL